MNTMFRPIACITSVFLLASCGDDTTSTQATASVELQVPPSLAFVSEFDTGLGESGAEILSVRDTDGLAVLTNVAGSVDILDLSDPALPRQLGRIDISGPIATYGTPNSAAIHPHKDMFLVAVGSAGARGAVAAYAFDGSLLAWAEVGIQPDSVAISPNGRTAVAANEAESTDIGADGGPGSLSVVDLAGLDLGVPTLAVRPIALPYPAGVEGFSAGRTDDIARLPITNESNTLEPESVTFSHDSRFAWVTLQENNGVVRLDVRTGELRFFGLGQTSHVADLNTDTTYSPTAQLTSFREPDGIAVALNGEFFVTADEGDTRNASAASGPRGGRTISIFDARTGAFIADTGSQLDDAAFAAGLYPFGRGNRGGAEPECLAMTHFRGRMLVAVTLERANAVALVDVTEPSLPMVIDLARAGVAPEGVQFFRRGDRLFVATANEVSGTVSVLEVL